jgi:hypothetical protein
MKPLRLISVVVAVTMLGVLAIEILRAREPHYQWRALSDWIEDGRLAFNTAIRRNYVSAKFLETDHDFQVASHAVKEIGPDAIPLLISWAQAEDSPLESSVLAWYRRDPFFGSEIESADYYHTKAYFGFMLVGDKGKSAWPLLIEWTHAPDPKRRLWALECLLASKPDKETIMPVLERLSHDQDQAIQSRASSQKIILFPQDQKVGSLLSGVPY